MTAKEKQVTVTCIVNNVWTSNGKLLKGQSIEVGSDEAKDLLKNKTVKTAGSDTNEKTD